MGQSPKRVLWACALILACSGCGSIPTRQLIADVVPAGESLLKACPAAPSDAVKDRIDAVKARLHQHAVVQFVVDTLAIANEPEQGRAVDIRKLPDLTASTLKDFGDRWRPVDPPASMTPLRPGTETRRDARLIYDN